MPTLTSARRPARVPSVRIDQRVLERQRLLLRPDVTAPHACCSCRHRLNVAAATSSATAPAAAAAAAITDFLGLGRGDSGFTGSVLNG
eukprot:scaffold9273_cov42-Phaeocystis_antarctica.AAC.2